MEDVIIGLLFVYFFVIRPILNQVRKGSSKKEDAKKQGGSKPRALLTPLLEKLKEKLREAAAQAEAAKRGETGSSSAKTWRDLFAEAARKPETEPWETPLESGELGDWQVEEPWVPGQPEAGTRSWEAVEPAEPAPARAAFAPKMEAEVAPSLKLQVTPSRRPARLGVNLRQAVVWSEILGLPVSLRDGD